MEPRERKVQITLTDEVPVSWPEPTHAESCNVYKMKSLVPWQNADVACSRVQSGFVNLARNARRLASPRQAHDASDVVFAFAGQYIDGMCKVCGVSITSLSHAGNTVKLKADWNGGSRDFSTAKDASSRLGLLFKTNQRRGDLNPETKIQGKRSSGGNGTGRGSWGWDDDESVGKYVVYQKT